MKAVLKIAVRNLLRHKRRTFLTGIVISVGLWMYIMMDSVMAGLDRGSMDNLINLSTSAVQIYTEEYDADKESYPLKHGLRDPDALASALMTRPRVKAVAPRTRFIGELSNFEETMPVIGIVVDPARDRKVFKLTDHLEGAYFSGHSEREIILGASLAKELGVAAGDFITLFALTKYESRNADDFRVIGLLRTTDPSLNKSAVYVTYAAANGFLDLENTVTELDVQLEHRINFDDLLGDMHAVKAFIDENLEGTVSYTFEELGAGILELIRQKKKWGTGMTLVFLLIAAVGIVNSVLMSVYERIREVGVLRAMGLEGKDVTKMFMLEGVMTGIVGSLGGVVLGVITVILLTTYGYPIDKLMGDTHMDTAGMPLWGTIYGEWNIPLMIGVFVFGVLVSVVASIPPSRKAAKMEVTKTLRFI